MDEKLTQALENAIWDSLDDEQGTPHSGVDMQRVAGEVARRLFAAGYEIVPRLHISGEGAAIVESGLTVRQAHEIKTGCSAENPCDNCRKYLT